jgi:DNA replication protein DnaC
MSESHFEAICQYARTLNIEPFAAGLAQFSHDNNLSEESLLAIEDVFRHMAKLKNEAVVNTLLRMSRLPLKNPKTFANFDFSRLHGKSIDRLTNLPALTAVYAHRNLAFIGPQGVGKTHLAMAYGRACCEMGLKAFFLKASELNQRLLDARRMDRCGAAINFLVKPSCLIIDEVGRCVFDKENTQLFFDLIDRRYSKEGTNCMIFTSNRQPDTWSEYFTGDSDLLCALDRIFDEASVFIIKGDSFRGQGLETIKLEAGPAKPSLAR